MKRYLNLTFLLLSLLISACSSQPKSEAWLTKEIKVNLPKIDLNQDYHDQQLLTFKYNNQENSVITVVDIQNNQLKVMGLSTIGIRLFEIQYNGSEVKAKQYIFIKQLPPPEQVLSDIMLSILPTTSWQNVLPPNWQLVDKGLFRTLINDQKQTIINITYNKKVSTEIRKPIKIDHAIFGYQIAIKSME